MRILADECSNPSLFGAYHMYTYVASKKLIPVLVEGTTQLCRTSKLSIDVLMYSNIYVKTRRCKYYTLNTMHIII